MFTIYIQPIGQFIIYSFKLSINSFSVVLNISTPDAISPVHNSEPSEY